MGICCGFFLVTNVLIYAIKVNVNPKSSVKLASSLVD